DARDPMHPTHVARLENPPNTSAEDVVVYTARYGPLKGHDIAAAGIQWCGDSRYDVNADRGLMLWDVTNPATPTHIGYLPTGRCPTRSVLAALFSGLRRTRDGHADTDRLGLRQYRECVAGAAHARKLDGIAGCTGFCTHIARTGSAVVRGVCSRPLG